MTAVVRTSVLAYQVGSQAWSELDKKDRKKIKRSGKKAWKRAKRRLKAFR